MTRRLRVAHVVVQPVLVWDDGEELTPGPGVQPLSLSLSAFPEFPQQLAEQLAEAENAASDDPA